MKINRVFSCLVLALVVGRSSGRTAPELDAVPGPVVVTNGLPAPAQWPVLRYEQPLRLLAVAGKGESVAGYQRVARRLRSPIEFRYLSAPNDDQAIYHVNDKWIEPTANPNAAELSAYSYQVLADTLQVRDGQPPAEVIFCSLLDNTNLLACVNAGAVLVTCGSVYPGSNSVFLGTWPAQPGPANTWMTGGSQRADGAALSGLPLERLAGHNWIPIPAAITGAVALATGQTGATFTRQLGKGTIIFAPMGLISRLYAAVAAFGRLYDHDEIWLRFWDQLLYETVHGAAAIPAYTDLREGAKQAPPGQDYVLAGKIVNRAARSPLAVSVHVTTPQGRVVFAREETIELPAGSEKAYTVRVPVAADWGAGLYPVYLTVGDPVAKKQLHQSLEFIPVAGQLSLALAADKKGYRLGETAQFTLTAASGAPWTGTLSWGIYDFRGRLLAVTNQPASFASTNAQSFSFSWRVADQGVRVDAFWAEVAAQRDGHEWGRAETKIYKSEPWSMRNEYQWSTWARIATAPPSLVPAAMRLMAQAGMNALGYAGSNELYYPAERWGWRYYNEGVGVNTWNPRIEYVSDAEIEAELRQEAVGRAVGDLASAAFVLASVNEEGGFGPNGWGSTYYWSTPVAPEKACRAFQWYLKTRYADVARLNATWHTNYQTWDDVKLTREFSGNAPVTETDGWAHPKESPLGAGVTGVSLAPYFDTSHFYAWYYDRFISAAKRVSHELINPVTVTMASAPASWIFASRECDVRIAGPGGWNESQLHSTYDGPEPGFSLVWGHFDWSVKTDNLFWGDLLTRSGHNDYWVDVPLMFNNDLTHTRASFAMRRWTDHLAGHERVILDSRPAPTAVGLLGANGLGPDLNRGNMASSLQVALAQGGYGLAADDPTNFTPYKILFAIGHQAVAREEADRLQQFVAQGGTFVFTSRFANQDEFGAPQAISPGQGLATAWGLQVTNRTDVLPPNYYALQSPFELGGVSDALKGFKATSYTAFREQVKQQGWTQLAEFEDHTPAILTRTLGKGRLYFVNMIYQSHWYIQWVTPTGPERQGFYKLVEWLCAQAGAQRTLRLDGDLAQVLHMAVKQFTDPTGHIRYAIVRTSGEVPWTAGNLNWLGPQTAGYDVLDGGTVGRNVPLNFKPGAGKLFAFVDKPLHALRVELAPVSAVGAVSNRDRSFTAGQPVRVTVRILGDDRHPVAGSFPLELHVADAHGHAIAGLHRSFSLESGGSYVLNTALNDLPGPWTITVTDGISRLTGSAKLGVSRSRSGSSRERQRVESEPGDSARLALAATSSSVAPGLPPWGWPSEIDEPAALRTDGFLAHLRALSDLYRADTPAGGTASMLSAPPSAVPAWMAKQRLCYFYNFFPNTRHAILQPLLDLDWPAYSAAISQAVRNGAEFIFTGEDLGLHPGSGLSVYPHHDGQQFAALIAALDGAKWSLATADGETVAATLGKGRILLCRESIDAAGYDSPSIVRWHQRWRAEQTTGPTIAAPSLAKLQRWWSGQETITTHPRHVTWFGENQPALSLQDGEVFTIVLPPTGAVTSVLLSVAGDANFDIGCEGRPVPAGSRVTRAGAVEEDWTQSIAPLLQQAGYRDDNGWRIVPIRVLGGGKAGVKLAGLKIEIK